MVTDVEYLKLKKRVDELENKLNQMARQLSTFYMKNDIKAYSDSEKQDNDKKQKDVTKYLFKGRQLSKRELVLKCVHEYVKENPNLNCEQLLEVFPNYIQGSLGIIKRVEDAEWYAEARKRFYFSDDDILHLVDGNFVVCTQWDINNIGKFLKLAKDLGFDIQPVTRKYTNH